MSLHSSPSAFTSHRVAPSAGQSSSADPQLFTAIALLLAVLIADSLPIVAAAPNLADLAALYVTTT